MEHFGERLTDFCAFQRGDEPTMKCKSFFFLFFLPISLADLPLQISYPPDFSDSRHYGLLLLMYVALPSRQNNVLHSLHTYTHLHTGYCGPEMIVNMMDCGNLQELEKLDLHIPGIRFCLLR